MENTLDLNGVQLKSRVFFDKCKFYLLMSIKNLTIIFVFKQSVRRLPEGRRPGKILCATEISHDCRQQFIVEGRVQFIVERRVEFVVEGRVEFVVK